MQSYPIFDLKVTKNRSLLDRKEAREAFKWYMKSIPERIAILKDFALSHGYTVETGTAFLPSLQDLFFDTCHEVKGQERLEPPELSMANDISIYISELLVNECENLSWKLHTFGKTSMHYHCPVIMGFKGVKYSNYSVRLDSAIVSYGERIIRGKPKETDLFVRMYRSSMDKA